MLAGIGHTSRNTLLHKLLRAMPTDGWPVLLELSRRQVHGIGQVAEDGKRNGVSQFCQKMIRKSSDRDVPLLLRGGWRVFTVPVHYWSLEEGCECQVKAIRDPGDNPLVPP
jgi:hypothetical protein